MAKKKYSYGKKAKVYIKNTFPKRYFKWKTYIRYKLQKWKYTFPSHPYKIVEIEPRTITHRVRHINDYDGLGQVIGGEWRTEPLQELSTYTGLKQRFEQGKEWKNTDYIDHRAPFFEEGSYKGYQDVDEFTQKRCSYLDDLYANIKENGYTPNYYKSDQGFPNESTRKESYTHTLEPLIAIGENGEIYIRDGKHRFTIASILDVKIPTYVVARHEKWQAVRDSLYQNNKKKTDYSHIEKHPDLEDLYTKPMIWD